MDTTTSTVGGMDEVFQFNTGYVSCIRVDGQPILPPLMTEKRREEMRRYREQAIIKEKELQERKSSQACSVTICKDVSDQSTSSFIKHLKSAGAANPVEYPNRSASTSPTPGVPKTSTPRDRRTYCLLKTDRQAVVQSSKGTSSIELISGSKAEIPEGVLRERKISVPPLDLDKSMSSVPSVGSSSALSYDGDEDKGDGASPSPSGESDYQKSEDNFTSAASSTGTFIIKRNSENNPSELAVRQTKTSEEYIASSEEEQDQNKDQDPPPTVVRRPNSEEQMFTRKRPAKYFDVDDAEIDKTGQSTFSSIPNYVPDNLSESHKSSILVSDISGSSSRFSPVPITNFSTVAKSLTLEFTKKFCPTSKFSSTPSTGTANTKSKVAGGSYDVRLSKDIPSSAEKVKDIEDDAPSDSSDKENIDMNVSKKHVRKLSYTLATPSAVLLDAVSKSKDKFFGQTLDTVPSAPSSVGVQSAYQTPEKSFIKESVRKQGIDSHDNKSLDGGTTATQEINKRLGGLNLDHGKQAHLERFLGDQDNLSKISSAVYESPESARAVLEMQQVFKQMQEKHESQLQRLAEEHRLQELRIKRDFESEMEKLKVKFSTIFNSSDSSRNSSKISPNSLADSVNNTSRSFSQSTTAVSEVKSNIMLPTSISEDITVTTTNVTSEIEQSTVSELQSRSKNTSVYHFTGGSSTIGEMQSSVTSTFMHSGGGHTELSGVGLSKLQSRMQLMSPRLFRTPADARSPLLKGLVFPDPLTKPTVPLRIPPKALEPSMKPKFDRISAAVKGFLTRRLLNTEKVQIIVQTIRDTVDLLLKLYEEVPSSGDNPFSKPQDNELHQRLIQQLTGACRSFHDVFFKLSTAERMAIIASDREKLKAKAMRAIASPARPNISNATLKSIERRMSHRSSPKRDTRKARSSKAYDPYHGSQSVKPKPIKTFNISPKRRRISYWDERNTVSRSAISLAGKQKQDLNGNNFKAASSRAPPASSRNYQMYGAAGGMGETFIVPSAPQTSRLGSSNNNGSVKSYMGSNRRDSVTPSSAKSISARSTQSNTSVASSSSGFNKSRTSTSRQPWNPGRTKH